MEWLWQNFGLISQKASLDFKLAKLKQLEAKSELDLNVLSMSIPAKAFMTAQLPFALNKSTVPNFDAFTDQTLQNMAKVLFYRDYMEDAYYSSLEGYLAKPPPQYSGTIENIIKRSWDKFVQDPTDPLKTRSGLLEYLIDSYGNSRTDEDRINKLVRGVLNSDNYTILSDQDLARFHQGWQIELPQNLTHVGVITLQNAIVQELLISSYYNSDQAVDYFRNLYDRSGDIVTYWGNN